MFKKKIETTIYITAKFFSHSLNLISIFFITKSLLLDQIATVNQFLIIIEIASILLFGIPEAVLFYLSKDKNNYLGVLLKFIRSYSWVYFLIGLVLGLVLPVFFSNNLLYLFFFNFSVLLFSAVIIAIFESYLLAVNKLFISSILSIVLGFSKLIYVLFLFFSFINFVLYINLVTLTYFLIALFAVLYLYFFENKSFFQTNSISKNFFIEFVKYSIPLWLSTIIGTLNKLIDKLTVGYFFSTSDFGIYSVLGRDLPYTVITATLISITTPLIIRLVSEKNYNSAFNIWKKNVILSSFFIVFVIFSNFILVDKIITFLYSEDYLVGKDIYLIYLLNLLPHIAYWGIFSKAFMKTKFIFIVSITGLIINVVLNFIFIHVFGLVGPAIATLLVSFLSILFYVVINQKLSENKFLKFIPIKELVIFISQNLLISFFINFLLKTSFFNLFSLFAQLSLIAILWFLILIIMNFKLIYSLLKANV
jgi:O-antigen/teichoic acid export membrane protein